MYIKKLGMMADFCNEDYIINFFETLYFQRMGIENMDASLSKMGNLQVLNLSYNKLTSIPSVLPPKLQELNLTGNMITYVATGSHKSLLHIGVAYNQLNDDGLKAIAISFPKLFCIDIAHNCLESITETIVTLSTLPDLKMLYLIGNPVMLAPNYRTVMKTKFNTLKVLDGVPTLNEAEGSRKKKTTNNTTRSTKSSLDTSTLISDVNENFTLDLHFRVLSNVDGIYLTEETCKPEILEALTQDSDKSSVFWFSYVDHHS